MLVGTGGWHGFSNSSPKPGVLSQKGWVWRWDSLWVHKLSAGRRTDGPLQAHEWHQRPPPKPHWNKRIPTVCAQLLWARLAQTSRSFHLIPPSAQWPLPPTPSDYPECHRCPHTHLWWWWASQPRTRHLTPLDRLERDMEVTGRCTAFGPGQLSMSPSRRWVFEEQRWALTFFLCLVPGFAPAHDSHLINDIEWRTCNSKSFVPILLLFSVSFPPLLLLPCPDPIISSSDVKAQFKYHLKGKLLCPFPCPFPRASTALIRTDTSCALHTCARLSQACGEL